MALHKSAAVLGSAAARVASIMQLTKDDAGKWSPFGLDDSASHCVWHSRGALLFFQTLQAQLVDLF